jgi:hypothetical protein
MDYHNDSQRELEHVGLPVRGISSAAGNVEYKSSAFKGRTVRLVVTNAGADAAMPKFPADAQRGQVYVLNNDPIGNVTMSVGTAAVYGVGYRAAAGGGAILLDNNVPTESLYFVGDIASNPNVSVVIA